MLDKECMDKLLEYFNRYVVRAERFIQQVKEQTNCEVCYERARKCGYSCYRHQVCNACFKRINLCPWCRSPKVGAYPELWYYDSETMEWFPLTEDIVRYGFLSNFNYDHYVDRFRQTMQTAVMNLETLIRTNISFKMLLHVVADCINLRTNFPIFVYHNKANIQYCSKRWKLIEEHICYQLSNNPVESRRIANKLRPSLAKLLYKIKELAPEGDLQIVMLEDMVATTALS
jgi:hypothetical protein